MDVEDKSHGKEMLLKEDFKLSLPQCETYRLKSRWAYLPYIIFAAVCLVACIIACSCALFCYNVLAAVKNIQPLATVPSTQSPDIAGKVDTDVKTTSIESDKAFTPARTVSSDKEEAEYYPDDREFETNEFDMEEYEDDRYDSGADIGSYDDGLAEGSGEIFDYDSEKPIRKRRSNVEDVKKCRKKCKGKGKKEKRSCRRKCAGKKMNTDQSGKSIISQLDFPAAHFEANTFDEPTQERVNTEYNKLKPAEKCTYNEEMEGILCLNRTFFPSVKSEGPLKIFKQAQWVNGASPVTFSKDSVATAKSTGVYLVYAQAFIGGNEPEKSIIIVQKHNGKETNALSCYNGVYPGRASNSQMQTCSVFGLMKLEEGDTVEIQRSVATIEISLDKDKTFFGLVRLGGVFTKTQ